ncbi:MAG: porin [Ignavibacteriae bacterium]|nr:porin [Ignavibacteriota bacterium]
MRVTTLRMSIVWCVYVVIAGVLSLANVHAQSTEQKAAEKPAEKKWFEKISLRGYTQVRYNRLLETNSLVKCEQCDKSIGEKGGFMIRRARLVFSGQVSDNVYFYIQPDFASSSGTGLHFAQIRDAYFDLSLDSLREFRFRIGQSKIPFGYENIQSSQNRLPFDRSEATNTAFPNERDLGVFFYWAPDHVRKLYTKLVHDGLKGTGDYGVVGLGTFNGQTANKAEANNNLHYVARVSYPLEVSGQIIEPGVQAYTGRFVIEGVNLGTKAGGDYLDERVAVSLNIAPKPFGILAEYNWGHSPKFIPKDINDTTTSNRIESGALRGGFATISYKIDEMGQTFIPYIRAQYYNGGKKLDIDARSYIIREYEIGVEWQPSPSFEFTTAYTLSDRSTSDGKILDYHQKGNFLRLQAQFNY